MANVTIRGAEVIDGTGTPAIVADVHVVDGRISLQPDPAAEVVDARGLVLAPGFIDTHTHDDWAVLDSALEPKISQGVTTVVVGNCGVSLAPPDLARVSADDLLGPPEAHRFGTVGEYLAELGTVGTPVNVVALTGHGSLRAAVMGADLDRPATAAEVQVMSGLLDEAMAAGAFGMSSGLEYQAGRHAPTDELIALASVVGAHGGLYATHMRDEADGVAEALAEAFEIGRAGGAAVIVSHHKCSGRANFGRSAETLALIEAAARERAVAFDVYPYDACSTVLTPEHHRNALRTLITGSGSVPGVAGRDLAALAAEWGIDVETAIARLHPAGAVYFDMHEDDVRRILAHPAAMVGSDGIPADEHPHPRLWGTFARVLGHYSRDVGLFPLAEAVRKMTSLPAQTFGLAGRGRIAPGYHADLVLFDPLAVRDMATFDRPTVPAAGIARVWVGGITVWSESGATGARPGGPLRRDTW